MYEIFRIYIEPIALFIQILLPYDFICFQLFYPFFNYFPFSILRLA